MGKGTANDTKKVKKGLPVIRHRGVAGGPGRGRKKIFLFSSLHRQLRQPGAEMPEDERQHDIHKCHKPAELAQHHRSSRSRNGKRGVELLDKIVPEPVEQDSDPDTPRSKAQPREDECSTHDRRDEDGKRIPDRAGPVVGPKEHEREMPCGPDPPRREAQAR